jgi:hypothetical protein
MDAARRIAVVYIDNPPPFLSTAAAIVEAISAELPGLHVTMVPSSLGDMYAKFLSAADREIAIDQQPFFLDGATVRLVREEEAGRVPCDMQFVTVVLARRMPVEHLSSLGVHSAFACFGQTLEVDVTGLSGTDCSIIRAVILLKHAQHVPPEVLVTRDPWPSCLITIRKLRVWRRVESFNEAGEYIPFFGAPPPPLYHRRAGNLSLAPLPMPLIRLKRIYNF